MKNGLVGYKKSRFIDKEFLKDYGIKKIAFFENSDTLSLVLLLDKNSEIETVTKYSLGLYVFPTNKSLLKNKDYLIWDSQPSLEQFGSFKYIIKNFPQPIKRIDSLIFFLYDREVYNGVIGNTIRIKNISI